MFQGTGPEALRPLGDDSPLLSQYYCLFGLCKVSKQEMPWEGIFFSLA